MANALHMYLMSGASGALVSERAAIETATDTAVESATFSEALSEFEPGITLVERQKAAIHAAIHAAADHTEDVPDPDALEAILEDADSSSKEKDSARAWLAIIQHGKETSTELSSSTKAASVAQSDSLVFRAQDTRLERVKNVDMADTEIAETASSLEEKKGAQSEGDSKAMVKGDTGSAALMKEQPAPSDDDEEVTSAEKLESAAKLTETVNKKPSQEKPVERTTQSDISDTFLTEERQVQKENAAQPKGPGEDMPASEIKGASDVKDFSKQLGNGKPPIDSGATRNNDSHEQPLQRDTVIQSNNTVSGEKRADTERTGSQTKEASKGSISQQAGATVAMADREVPQQSELESLVLEPRSGALPRTEVSSGQQSLAGATQARAEQAQAAVNATSSGGQADADDKGQRHSSAMNQAQWLQMQSESGKGRELQQEQGIQPHSSEPESQVRVLTGLAGTPLQDAGSTINPSNSTMASVQLVQAQGSASQPQLSIPQVNEALRQPVNLLAADAAGQLRDRLVMMARQSIHSAEIKLEPAELGSMTIRVNMQQDQASVQFMVQQAHAKEVLEQQLPRLRDMLQEQGIQLAEGQVEQQESKQQGRGHGRGQQAGDNTDTDTDLSAPTVISSRHSDRLVDYYA